MNGCPPTERDAPALRATLEIVRSSFNEEIKVERGEIDLRIGSFQNFNDFVIFPSCPFSGVLGA